MRTEVIETPKGLMNLIVSEPGESISNAQDFLDLLGECRTKTLVLEQRQLTPEFFDLRSRIAGEILQKVSNYSLRLVIVGDIAEKSRGALHDFIYESNRTGKVVFAPNREAAYGLLK